MELIYSVYFLLMVGLFGSLLYLVSILISGNNKSRIIYFIIFPPCLVYFALANINKTKDALIMAIIFIVVITFVGFISGEPFGKQAIHILYTVFLWPVKIFSLL